MSQFGETITQTIKVSITQFADTIFNEYPKAQIVHVFFDTNTKEFINKNNDSDYYKNYTYYGPLAIKIGLLSEKSISYEKLSSIFNCNRLFIGFNPKATIQLKIGKMQYMSIANETKIYKNSHIYNYIVKEIPNDAKEEIKKGFKDLVKARIDFNNKNDNIIENAHMRVFKEKDDDFDEIVF